MQSSSSVCSFAVYLGELHGVTVLLQHYPPVAPLREAWSQLQKSTAWINQFMTASH